jgi:rhodanese-related sulfurtransferase
MNIDVQASDLAALEPFRLVDIRTSEEVEKEPLPCDHLHIPMDRLLSRPDLLEKDRIYVLVCAAGMRTRFAAEILRREGFSQVYSLVGGNRSLAVG